jgi:hypothetical protein
MFCSLLLVLPYFITNLVLQTIFCNYFDIYILHQVVLDNKCHNVKVVG